MTTLNINFYAENITEELRAEFNNAVLFESCDMNKQMTKDQIKRLENKIENKNGTYSEEEIQAFEVQKVELEELVEKLENKMEELEEVYTKVVTSMSKKNENGFGNKKDQVRTVLRVLATWENKKLQKYAVIPCFENAELGKAMDTIHVTSVAEENGELSMTDEVKNAYKNANKELETIIKETFSLPFATEYTEKTRVKLNATDKKNFHECYVKGIKNEFSVDEETNEVSFKKQSLTTVIKAKKDRKSGEIKYDYSGLVGIVIDVAIKEYFKQK